MLLILDNHFPNDNARVARWKQNITNGPWLYCCVGTRFDSQSISACVDGEWPFPLPNANPLYGFAALTNARSETPPALGKSSTSLNSSDNICGTGSANTIAVGAGVGVPLCVITLASVGWAVWERRRRRFRTREISKAVTRSAHYQPQAPYYKPELPSGSGQTNLELRGSQRDVAELAGI